MREQQLWEAYPRLYHMATVGSWPSIRERGLLSTAALLDLFDISGADREAIECRRRPESVAICHPVHGEAVIRDQKPMTDAALARCVQGISVSDWLKMLNRRVYFWPVEGRLRRLLSAKAYARVKHCVLRLNTRSLVTAYAKSIHALAYQLRVAAVQRAEAWAGDVSDDRGLSVRGLVPAGKQEDGGRGTRSRLLRP